MIYIHLIAQVYVKRQLYAAVILTFTSCGAA